MPEPYIRFDWAMKKLLRNKANHEVIEGLLVSLTGKQFTIEEFLESEGNQEDESDKFNRVDMLARDKSGTLIIIEIQNTRELDYFHRMLYGTSKLITEYIDLGDRYDKVRKVYSVNIVYFELGQGADYVYHGKTDFRGLHNPEDKLLLSDGQRKRFFGMEDTNHTVKEAGDIFPEYYVLRVNEFNSVTKTPIEEWMRFLKTGDIAHDTTTPGLQRARQVLRIDALSPEERRRYMRKMENLRYQRSVIETSRIEGFDEGFDEGFGKGKTEGVEEGRSAEREDTARKMKSDGLPPDVITRYTGLSAEEIAKL